MSAMGEVLAVLLVVVEVVVVSVVPSAGVGVPLLF